MRAPLRGTRPTTRDAFRRIGTSNSGARRVTAYAARALHLDPERRLHDPRQRRACARCPVAAPPREGTAPKKAPTDFNHPNHFVLVFHRIQRRNTQLGANASICEQLPIRRFPEMRPGGAPLARGHRVGAQASPGVPRFHDAVAASTRSPSLNDGYSPPCGDRARFWNSSPSASRHARACWLALAGPLRSMPRERHRASDGKDSSTPSGSAV